MSLVTGIIIFFDAALFLDEAIQSVLAQSYADWELLLVDDGSTDGSTDIARHYVEQYPALVRYLEHPGHQNLGMSAARNLGISHARGDYIAFLDADDVWLAEKLERQVAILTARPEIDAVYGDTELWYSWTGVPEDRSRDCMRGIGIPPNTVVAPPGLITRCYPLGEAPSPTTCSLLVRKQAVERVGGFEKAFRGIFEDQAFLAKLYLTATVLVTGDCLDRYRQHSGSCVSVSTRAGQHEAATLSFLNWLEAYLFSQGVRDARVWEALRRARWPHRHPILHALSQRIARVATQVGDAAWTMNNSLKRRIAGKRTGAITAHPNPILVAERFTLGVATLTWEVTGHSCVEVHVGAPDGPLVSRSAGAGSATTGTWVKDGTLFFLQDTAGGLPLTSANTLSATRVVVVRVVLPRADRSAQASS